MVWFSGMDVLAFFGIDTCLFSFAMLVWFSSARSVVWLSSLVFAILFFHNALPRNFACGRFIQIFQRFKFQFKIWQTSVFCKFVHFQGDIFRSMSCIFFFTIATIFARDPRHQYSFMHECNSTLNALSSIPNQNASSRLAI